MKPFFSEKVKGENLGKNIRIENNNRKNFNK